MTVKLVDPPKPMAPVIVAEQPKKVKKETIAVASKEELPFEQIKGRV
jgi:hypothetical protein